MHRSFGLQSRAPAPTGRRLRVLQIGKYYSPYRGGIETHLQMLAERLDEYVDVEVVVSGAKTTTESGHVNGIRVTRLGTWSRLAGAPICPSLWGAIHHSNADILHIHLPNPPAVLAYLASRVRRRLVLTYHSDIVRQKILGKLVNPIRDLAMKQAAAVIATSPHSVNNSPMLARHRDRCVVIPFGVPLDGFDQCAADSVAKLRRRFGPRMILAVGRLIYYKGFEYLIRAMRGLDAHLVIVGDGPKHKELRMLSRSLGVASRVHLVGSVADVVPYYHAADVFVLPSVANSEAFGIVQLEAMACRTPVVNTQLDTGVPYVSPDGVTGLTVSPADPVALAGAVSRLLYDEALRARFAAAARLRVEQEFSVEAMVNRTMQVYEWVAAGRSVPAGSLKLERPAVAVP